MLLSNQNMGLGKDDALNSGDILGNFGSLLQVNSPILPHGDTDLLIKVIFFPFAHNVDETYKYLHFPLSYLVSSSWLFGTTG